MGIVSDHLTDDCMRGMYSEDMKLLDSVYMLVTPGNDGVVYCVAATAKELWQRVESEEIMGTGATKAHLHKLGYRAKRVLIYLPT